MPAAAGRPAWPADAGEWRLDPAVIHLNHGSFGAVPRAVLAEQARWRARMEAAPTRFFWRELPEAMDAVRADAAAFLGCEPSRTVLLPNVTSAVATILTTVPIGRGDEVLVTDDSYPAVVAAVDRACRRAGARMSCVRLAPGEVSADAYHDAVLAAVTPRTRLAVIDHVTSMSALRIDARRLSAALHERGVIVAVDGAHAPGAIGLDVDSVAADYYTGNFHKWCCAPRGAAFLAYAAGAIPPVAAVAGSRSDEGLPAGAEWWGTQDYTGLLAVPAALRHLESFGWGRVRDGNAQLARAGGRVVATALGAGSPRDIGLPMAVVPLSAPFDAIDVTALRQALLDRGCEVGVVQSRGAAQVRVSAHLYNELAHFEELARVLSAVLAELLATVSPTPATGAPRPPARALQQRRR